MCVKVSLQLCLIFYLMDYSLPGSWSMRDSPVDTGVGPHALPDPGMQNCSPWGLCIAGQFFTSEPQGSPYMCVYICLYMYRERERERENYSKAVQKRFTE